MGLYYYIWVDLIKRATSLPQNRQNWKPVCFTLMSICMSLNFALLMAILQRNVLKIYYYDIDFVFLPDRLANTIRFIILFVLPVATLNYFLIFHKDRYKKYLQKYPTRNGKLFLTYFFISILLPIVLIWTNIFLSQLDLIE
jgi:hypothetical protein